MAGQLIRIAASDGSGRFGAWLALPPADRTPAPGVVMLHEIFGVTGWIRETAEMFAAHGYCVAAPDMFWRMHPGFEGDFNSEADTAEGRGYKARIDHDKAVEDMAAVIAHLKTLPQCNGRIGVTGFCTGGTMAYFAATRMKVDAAAPYYGTQVHEFLAEGKNISCPTIFHMGEHDDRVPAGLPDKLRAAVAGVPDVAIYTYDAGHAFAHTQRPDYHAAEATKLAHGRTFALFDRLR